MSFTDTPKKADILNNANIVNQYTKNNQHGLLVYYHAHMVNQYTMLRRIRGYEE